MSFEKRKQDVLGKRDKSDKQSWDKKILGLCRNINSKKEYYTTSSCAGRVVLIIADDKKKSGLFLFRIHNKIRFRELKNELEKAGEKISKLVYFKQEPCILHVACFNLKFAQVLLDRAKLAGWKNSGIIASSKRLVCELRSTEKLELPILDKSKVLVDDKFLKLLVKEANKKIGRTWKKIERLERMI